MNNNKKNKKPIIALLVVAIVGIIGITFAFFSDEIGVNNKFKTKPYGTTVTEVFTSPDNWLPGTSMEKVVKVKNSGEVDEAVRISYTEEWKTKNNGNLSGWLHTDGTKSDHTTEEELESDVRAAVINFTNKSDWTKVTEDGTNYYYYKYKLAEGEETGTFIDSVTFNAITKLDDTCEEPVTENGKTTITCNSSGADYDNATYTLTLTIETIQYDKYKEAWGTNFDIVSEKTVYENFAQHIITNSNPVTVENYTDGNTKEAYTFNHAQTEQTGPLTDYRYIGDSPNNYVSFNCDDDGNNCKTWRIIGVFTVENEEGVKEQRVKLIRGSALKDEMAWDTNGATLPWEIDGSNEWSTSSLNTYLNNTYYSSLSMNAQLMIQDTKYYLGGKEFYGNPTDKYTELGNTEEIYT